MKTPAKEPWDSSTEKAKTLTMADFGTPDEVMEMARPVRQAKGRLEAEEALENIITSNGTVERSAIKLTSKAGLSAFLRRSSIGKLVSGSQKKYMPKEALWLAAANIDRLFENAIEPWRFELNPHKNNAWLKDRRILYAPLEYEGRILPVKITVKEYQDQTAGTKIYSLEAINIEIKK